MLEGGSLLVLELLVGTSTECTPFNEQSINDTPPVPRLPLGRAEAVVAKDCTRICTQECCHPSRIG